MQVAVKTCNEQIMAAVRTETRSVGAVSRLRADGRGIFVRCPAEAGNIQILRREFGAHPQWLGLHPMQHQACLV
jgi:hypothetical protein